MKILSLFVLVVSLPAFSSVYQSPEYFRVWKRFAAEIPEYWEEARVLCHDWVETKKKALVAEGYTIEKAIPHEKPANIFCEGELLYFWRKK